MRGIEHVQPGLGPRRWQALVLGCGRAGAAGLTLADPVTGAALEHVDWITLDAMSSVDPDLVCLLGRDPIPLEENSIDHAFALQLLEHIGRQGELGEAEGWFYFWRDLYRVLRPGGRLTFECPYYTGAWAWADPTHARAISQETFTYLDQTSYLKPGAIPQYRPEFDFRLRAWGREGEWCGGVLEAIKPLRRYWQ